MDNPYTLKGKTILVTGASSGIGRQISIHCAAHGANVILLGRNQERLQQALSMLSGEGHEVICGDLKDENFIIETCKKLPPLDGLVQSAGLMQLTPLKFISAAFIDELFAINLRAPILFTSTLAKQKKLKPYSAVVLLSSITGAVIGCMANSVYGAMKGGIQAFCKSAALELSKNKIRINCIAPGMVETEGIGQIGQHVSTESIEQDKKNYPLGRYGSVYDIASACLFLLSDSSAWTTGSTLIIDGGYSAQ